MSGTPCRSLGCLIRKGYVPQSIPITGISVFPISVLRNLAVTVDTLLAGQKHDRNSYLRFRDK